MQNRFGRLFGVAVGLTTTGLAGCATSHGGSPFEDETVDAGVAIAPAPTATTDAAPAPPGFSSDASTSTKPASCDPCDVTGPGTFCGIDVDITPYVTGGPFGGFQSVAGTGFQDPITITLSQPITWVSVQILDPDYPDFIQVYDASGAMTGQVQFVSDGTPNVLTNSTSGLGGAAIKSLKLVPDSRDYVAYDGLQVIPAGCDPPPPR